MNKMKVSEIASAIQCSYAHSEHWIEHVTSDSRAIEPNSLFIALIGEQFDGHDYVLESLEKGATFAVVSKWQDDFPDNVFLVKDTKLAFLQIAGLYRSQRFAKVVAITGSVGKTTTKDMVACVLESQYKTLKTKENLNNEIGLSQMLLLLDDEDEMAALELGVDGPNQMKPMSLAAAPEVAIVTNIGVSHLEAFGDQLHIMKEKLEIETGLKKDGILLLNGDDDLLRKHIALQERVLYFGIDGEHCHVRGSQIKVEEDHQSLVIGYKGKGYPVNLPALGRHNVYNALAAFATGVTLGIPPTQAALALTSYVPTGMRQKIVSFHEMKIVEDCYNSSPQSMTSAMVTLQEMNAKGKKIAIVSDMLELGTGEQKQHYDMGAFIGKVGIDVLLLTGERSKEIHRGAMEQGMQNSVYFETQDELTDYLKKIASTGDILWFKASRGMRLEYVIKRFYEEWI